MIEEIEMSLSHAVNPGFKVVPRLRDQVRVEDIDSSAVLIRKVPLRSALVPVAGYRDDYILLYERECLPSLFRSDQIEGAKLVVFSPTPPVRQFGLPTLIFSFA